MNNTISFLPASPVTYEVGRKGTDKIPHDGSIKHIIIHTTVGGLQSVINTFQSGNRGASAHYVVDASGIFQMVDEANTAYHAGNFKMNLMSIGIEHVDNGRPNEERPEDLYKLSGVLVANVCKRYSLPIDRSVIRMHKEVIPTACPGTLDLDKIISYALKVANGENILQKDTPSYIKTMAPYHKNISVAAVDGVNVRNSPSRAGNIIEAAMKDAVFAVEGVVFGEDVLGNNKWFKIKGQERFIWSGGTNTPNPPITESAPPSPDPVGVAQTPSEIPVDVQEKVKALLEQTANLVKENKSLTEQLTEARTTIVSYETETRNVELIKKANQMMTEEISAWRTKNESLKRETYETKQKLANAYVQAFDGWELIEVPKGIMAVAHIPMIAFRVYGLIVSAIKHNLVIGWKKDSKLHSVETYLDLYGELPQGD